MLRTISARDIVCLHVLCRLNLQTIRDINYIDGENMRACVHRSRLRIVTLGGFLVSTIAAANAEEVAVPASAAETAPVTSTPPEPGAVMPIPPPASTPVEIAQPATPPAEPLPKAPPAISTAFGLRVEGQVQGSGDKSKFNDFGLNTIYLEARFSGTIDKYFGWQANFNGSAMPASSSGAASIMDLILKFDAADEFHVWGGRLLVPSDRSNFSGPFFISPWNYPGVFGSAFIGPKTGANGRDDGVVVWGQFLEGKAKYFAGAFNLDNAAISPLYSARVNVALLGTEPGLWGSSTYYGAKDIVAVGGGYQYQKNGSGTTAAPTNLNNVMGDLLAEKNIPGVGTPSLEAAYYHFDKGAPAKQAFFVLASFLTADYLGVGKLQPLVRWQQASPQAGGTTLKVLDAFVTYVIHDYNLKLAVGYQRTDLGSGTTAANAIQIGLQMQE